MRGDFVILETPPTTQEKAFPRRHWQTLKGKVKLAFQLNFLIGLLRLCLRTAKIPQSESETPHAYTFLQYSYLFIIIIIKTK